MSEQSSLRERKKHATRVLLMETALSLFEEKGFDNVSVAEIAEAAEVSKATVFNYFPTKEDLVLAGAKAHTGEPANIVRARPVGQTPHGALREYFLRMLEHHEPMAGLSVHPMVLRVQRVIRQAPGLALRAMDHRRRASELLAQALIEEGSSELTARLVATQLMHTQHILAQTNLQRIHAGETIEEIYPDAVATAEHAFRLLEHGIGDFMRREAEPSGAPDSAFHGTALHDTGPHGDAGHCVEYAPGEGDMRRAVERVLRGADDEMYENLVDPDRP